MSRTAKLGLAAALLVLVVVVLAWASVVSLTGAGPTAAASAFFKTIADRGAPAAYQTASAAFQHATTQDAFAATVQARGLSDYKSADWTVRSQQGPLAELTGAVNLKNGGVAPANVGLVKGANGWQVLSLELPQGGLVNGAASGAAPAQADASANPDYDSAAPASQPQAAPAPPTSAPQAPAYGQLPAAAANAPAGLVGAQPAAPGYGEPQGAGGDAAPVISRSRVARICGQTLMHNSWADAVRLHCPDGIGAAPGSTTRCAADVNGHHTGLTATMNHYDPVTDDAQLTCRLD